MDSNHSTSDCRGWIWDIKRYALHDGPGIRTTVFFKGCPLTCPWCCNPESQTFKPELIWIGERCLGCGLCGQVCPAEAVQGEGQINRDRCDLCGECAARCPGEALCVMGREVLVEEILSEVSKDAVFYSRSGGGLTLSGGEPLAQADFAIELLRRYKTEAGGAHAAVETCGYVPAGILEKVAWFTDTFLFDLKHMDPEEHLRLTGVDNHLILKNVRSLAASKREVIVRLPLIPGYNDSLENIRQTAEFTQSLPGINRLDLLPYHRLGEPKYLRLSREYPLAGTRPPGADKLTEAVRIMEEYGLTVHLGG